MTKQKLFYFTASYPFGYGQQWKANELSELVHEFEDITVVPYSYQGNFDNPQPLPHGIKQVPPLFKDGFISITSLRRPLLSVVTHPRRWQFIREFFVRRVYRRYSHFVKWLSASLNAIRLLEHPVIRNIVDHGTGAILYFYWGSGSCEFLPFVNTGHFGKVVVRMHRYDLFEYANDGYIPYRAALLDKITLAAPSSIAGVRHLQQLYPGAKAAVKVLRCGTVNRSSRQASPSEDSVLRIVSCSYLSPVKRVDLMIDALQFVNFPILWRHVGDGELSDVLKEMARSKGLQRKFIFEGNLDSPQVMEFLTRNTFDLFVNTSASEGLPFSIMEALSAGIPVMATDVGGSGEVVHQGVGVLLPGSLTAQMLARALQEFYERPAEEKRKLRARAYNDYAEKWDARPLSRQLAAVLKS